MEDSCSSLISGEIIMLKKKKLKTSLNKKLISCLCFTFLYTLLIINPTSASDDGGDAGAFLKNGIGVRPISMGKAFIAVADDVHAGYWNPAGLANLTSYQLSAMYSNPMNYAFISDTGVKDIGYHTLSFALPTGFGSLGLNMAYLSAGDIQVVEDASGPTGETFSNSDLGFLLSYARSATNDIQLGLNLKILRQKVWTENGSGIGFDMGVLYAPVYNLKLGLMLQNLIEPSIQLLDDGVSNSVPRSIGLGISYKLMEDMILVGASIDKAGGRSAKFHMGTEVLPMNDLSLRAGYTTDTGELTAGVGVKVSAIQIDYGFGFLDIGSTHRISLTVDLSRLMTSKGKTPETTEMSTYMQAPEGDQ
ncbi:PorV/PorQ family protein [Candidatus Poribacteria bacterium]|nr:PorV/PorQ family protein [Candidatus Poribacteria bacterium]